MADHQVITIIGGGLAGCEAAWQAAQRDCPVHLYEMKPHKFSPAHNSSLLAELVCSNSLRSADLYTAAGLLKEEIKRLNSLLLTAAAATSVPAGKALAVDRTRLAKFITSRLTEHPQIKIIRTEVEDIPENNHWPIILASGPLTSSALAASLAELTGYAHLSFYDAIAPIIYAESLNRDIIYQASRYSDAPGDYLNCPMDYEQYMFFIKTLNEAEKVTLKSFEKKKYFEGCLPIEVMAERGTNTLRFGPMKPVGLPDPRTKCDPYAVVQLRKENREETLYNMVGFQTKLTYPEQKKVFRLIPGMEKTEFARLGSIHRNTFVCAPKVLLSTLQFNKQPNLFLAGQLTGVEGYVESTAMGLLAGINSARMLKGEKLIVPPANTAIGSLVNHLTQTSAKHFQPSNINFGLFPTLEKKIPKKLRGNYRAEIALKSFEQWRQTENI